MDRAQEITCPLRSAARRSPEAVATLGRRSLTYRDLDGLVTGAARWLEEAGLRAGERVGLYFEKDERYVALLLAALRAGVVACPISTRLPPAGVAALLATAGCPALVSEGKVGTPEGVRTFRPGDLTGDVSPDALREEVHIPLDRPATVVFTSGSTGRPKAALHTFGNHYFNALGSNENIPLSAGDVWLHLLPLYHVGGLSIVFRCLLTGAALALPEPDAPVGRAISRSGATHVSLVATQLRRLLDEGADLSGVKAILLGASGIPAGLLDEAHRRGLPVHTSYGLTETASQATTTRSEASREELATSGSPLRYRKVEVAEDGEILVGGEVLFSGYVEGSELTRPFDAEGFFHTKDLGRFDEEGRLVVLGRKDNLFVSGGENVLPEEVEEELRRLEGVEDAVVVPVESAEFGFRPAAFVRTRAEKVPDDLSGRLRERLEGFKVPVVFYGWPLDAPVGMKVDREFFRQRAREFGCRGA